MRWVAVLIYNLAHSNYAHSMTLLTTNQIIEHLRFRLFYGPQQYVSDPATYQHWQPFQDPAFRLIETWSFQLPNPPLTEQQCLFAEHQLGFRLPLLLRHLYLTIGDGGFGPGDGISGFLQPHKVHRGRTLLSSHREMTVDLPEALEELEISSWQWPRHLVPLCAWSSGTWCVDCSSEQAPILRWEPDGDPSRSIDDEVLPEAPSLHHWLSAWLAGRSFQDRDNLVAGVYEFDNY